MIKKFLIFIMSVALSIGAVVFFFCQFRHFYQVDNMTFTVWKKWGGYCYVTPYRYWGLFTPKRDYIKMSNVGNINIYLDKDSTLLIFNESTNDGICNDVECHLHTYKFKHFYLDSLSSMEETRLFEMKRVEYRQTLPFIDISPRSMWVEAGNSSLP